MKGHEVRRNKFEQNEIDKAVNRVTKTLAMELETQAEFNFDENIAKSIPKNELINEWLINAMKMLYVQGARFGVLKILESELIKRNIF